MVQRHSPGNTDTPASPAANPVTVAGSATVMLVWQSATAIKNWRALAGYHERVARLREVVDRFEPRTLEITARV